MIKRMLNLFRSSLLTLAMIFVTASCGDSSPAEQVLTSTSTPTQLQSILPIASPTKLATPVPPATSTPLAASPLEAALPTPAPVYTYTVINTYPHDRTAWTQGLLFDNGELYEGTGSGQGQFKSVVRKVDLETGAVLQELILADEYYGEGIVIFGDKLYQITWLNQTGFIYDKNSFELLQTFSYPTEGWGLTSDGTHLIMSDGSARLTYRDPETLAVVRTVDVYDSNGPVLQLNELEYIQGEIYANIWTTERIARISPETGAVTGWIDLTGLLPATDRQGNEWLNGIAYLADEDRLFVTGKLWPKLFEIKLVRLP